VERSHVDLNLDNVASLWC